jgi:sulfur-carrier protein
MPLKILLFGKLAEIMGENTVELPDLPDTDKVQRAMIERCPALAEEPYVVAVDKNVIQGNTILLAGSEVAFLPPFSGG